MLYQFMGHTSLITLFKKCFGECDFKGTHSLKETSALMCILVKKKRMIFFVES